MEYAGFWKRFWAKAIDVCLYVVVSLIIFSIVYFVAWDFSKYVGIILTVFFLIYNILMIKIFGKTLGKFALKIRAVRTDGSKAGLLNSFMRELLNIFYWITALIPLIFVITKGSVVELIINIFTTIIAIEFVLFFTNSQKKTLHDYIGGTVVIKDGVAK